MAKRKIKKKAEKRPTSQQALQQKYYHLQMIEAQMQQAQKEMAQLEQKQQELAGLRDSLGELKNTKSKSKSFSQIGLGIYAESTISDTKELLVNVGANLLVKKKVAEVQEILDKQLEQFTMITSQLTQSMQVMAYQAQVLEHDLSGK